MPTKVRKKDLIPGTGAQASRGDIGARGTPTIPPNAALRFVIKLVGVMKSSR